VKSFIVDCDTGIDDAMALLYLLGDPDVEICAITTVFGNTPAATAARNTLAVLEVAGVAGTIPVAVGAELTLLGHQPGYAAFVHGDDGLGDVGHAPRSSTLADEHAASMISRLTKERPGELHLLAVGPLTNLALALAIDPDLSSRVASVTIMGGAAHAPGNVTSHAEANIHNDPEAARRVLRAPWATTLVPLDATMRELITEEHQRELAASGSAVGTFTASILDVYFDFYVGAFGRRSSACHDPLAAAIATGDVVPTKSLQVEVDVDTGYGPGRGVTLCDTRHRYLPDAETRPGPCTLVLETDGTFGDRLTSRLVGFSPPSGR